MKNDLVERLILQADEMDAAWSDRAGFKVRSTEAKTMREAAEALSTTPGREEIEEFRDMISVGLASFCIDQPDFTMSAKMRRDAADHIMGQALNPAILQLLRKEGA